MNRGSGVTSSNKDSEGSAKFCTQCGAVAVDRRGCIAKQLYDEDLLAKTNVLKLVECRECDVVADRYVESDGVLVLIDLVLQSPKAYRHVLLNGRENYRRWIAKLCLVTVLCDGYIRWATLPSPGEFFEQEFQFYYMCLRVASGLLSFVMVGMCGQLLGKRSVFSHDSSASFWGLLMAYNVRICNLAAFLWASGRTNDDSSPAFTWTFISVLFFIATMRTLQVCQGHNLLSSLLLGSLSHLVFILTTNLDWMMQSDLCKAVE